MGLPPMNIFLLKPIFYPLLKGLFRSGVESADGQSCRVEIR